jgi:hypothetical protein
MHEGNFVIPPQHYGLQIYRGNMCPRNLALHHPAADLLLQYATNGCPTRTGKDWILDEMETMAKGSHPSTLNVEAAVWLQWEMLEEVAKGQARIVTWEEIKENPLKELRISLVAMIPHK